MVPKLSVYWTKSKYWVEFTDYSSIQQNELYAVIKVLQDFLQELNIVADSAFVVGVVQNIFNAVLHSTKHSLLTLFKLLQALIQNKNSCIFITRVRSHINLPGYLTFGKAQVDKLVAFPLLKKTMDIYILMLIIYMSNIKFHFDKLNKLF